MRTLCILIFAIVALPDRPAPAPNKKAADMPIAQQLLGEWRFVKGQTNGEKHLDARSFHIVFTETNLLIYENGKKNAEEDSTYTLDTTMIPVHINIVPKSENTKKINGILNVSGDTLIFCFPHNGEGERPTEFVSRPGSRNALYQFERLKQ